MAIFLSNQGSPLKMDGPKPKLAFFDLDGTLVNSSSNIHPLDKAAVSELRNRGITASVATGRPYFGAKNIVEELGLTAPCMFSSGAQIIDPLSRRSLLEMAISSSDIRQVATAAKTFGLYAELYTLESYFTEGDDKLGQIHATYLGQMPERSPLEPLIDSQSIVKIGFMAWRGQNEDRLRELLAKFPDLTSSVAFGAAHPEIVFANITHPKATRENAFNFITQRLGVLAEEVIAFGDGEADIPFLKLSGIGVAMGNAPESVTAAADLVTKSVEEQGVAFGLERVLGSY